MKRIPDSLRKFVPGPQGVIHAEDRPDLLCESEKALQTQGL